MRPALLMQNVARLVRITPKRGVTWIPPVDPHAGVKVGDEERCVLCGPSCGRGLRVMIRLCVLCAAQIIDMRREVNTAAVNTVAAIVIDCETPHSAAEVTELKGARNHHDYSYPWRSSTSQGGPFPMTPWQPHPENVNGHPSTARTKKSNRRR